MFFQQNGKFISKYIFKLKFVPFFIRRNNNILLFKLKLKLKKKTTTRKGRKFLVYFMKKRLRGC